MSKKDNKKKKKKTVYIDDGRTIADMSGVGRHYSSGDPLGSAPRPKSTFKDHMRTYFSTVRAMFLPMLAFMGIITLSFGILYLLLMLAS